MKVLITGSAGLIGGSLVKALIQRGDGVACLDLKERGEMHGDIGDLSRLVQAADGCDGIVHLAAVSRVLWGEEHPELCWQTNVVGLRNVLRAAASPPKKPWVLFASSREVYGEPETLPVTEDFPVRPVNVYGRSKAEGEELIAAAQRDGLCACTIRLSNVYGSVRDHADRVVPAFVQAAAWGQELRVDGAEHIFDFTHVDDVTSGIVALCCILDASKAAPPPILFVSGTPTTLGALAALAIDIAGTTSTVRLAPPRNYDVARFFGNPARAEELLGWKPQTRLDEGLAKLMQAVRDEEAALKAS